MVHLFTVLFDLLVSLSELFVQPLDFSLVVVQFEELQLHAGSGYFILKALITLSLTEGRKDSDYDYRCISDYI